MVNREYLQRQGNTMQVNILIHYRRLYLGNCNTIIIFFLDNYLTNEINYLG